MEHERHEESSMKFRRGDRVRIMSPRSEYTGCRGTIADSPEHAHREPAEAIAVLGHRVAIDGENGRTRDVLVSELERIQAARVTPRAVPAQSSPSRASHSAGLESDPGRR